MRRWLWIAGLCVFALAGGPRSGYAEGGIGVGPFVGEPTGIGAKLWFGPRAAFDLALAWSTSGENAAQIHADYLLHAYGLLRVSRGSLPLHYGLGVRVKMVDEDRQVGIRAPVGLSYQLEKQPVEVFLEVAPILDVAPSTVLHLNGSVGARVYFR